MEQNKSEGKEGPRTLGKSMPEILREQARDDLLIFDKNPQQNELLNRKAFVDFLDKLKNSINMLSSHIEDVIDGTRLDVSLSPPFSYVDSYLVIAELFFVYPGGYRCSWIRHNVSYLKALPCPYHELMQQVMNTFTQALLFASEDFSVPAYFRGDRPPDYFNETGNNGYGNVRDLLSKVTSDPGKSWLEEQEYQFCESFKKEIQNMIEYGVWGISSPAYWSYLKE